MCWCVAVTCSKPAYATFIKPSKILYINIRKCISETGAHLDAFYYVTSEIGA